MKRIGISQRVIYDTSRLERRDVLDQKWQELADLVGLILIPIPNKVRNPERFVDELEIEGLIFSGGNNIGYQNSKLISGLSLEENDYAYERDVVEAKLLEWAVITNTPLIGVCRGMQFISAYLGGSIMPVIKDEHVATMHHVEFVNEEWKKLYNNQKEFNSFHNWGLVKETLADSLSPTGIIEPYVESFQHKEKKIYGIMWHPERYDFIKSGDINLFCKVFKT
jgi:gamma-glutamyl-gamma-aminobutyrate hydrolase PuuD